MVVADAKESLTITGNGDVVEPHDGVVGVLSSFTDLQKDHRGCAPARQAHYRFWCPNLDQPLTTHHSQVTSEDRRSL